LPGPRPRLKSDLLDDAPVTDKAAAALGAAGGAAAAAADALAKGGKVEVGFYGESLCPDCQHMVRDVLQPMFDNGIAEAMQLT
jgi:hypothetical protein